MKTRRTIIDCFPDRREQSFVMAVLTVCFGAILVRSLYVGARHGGLRDIEDTSARQTIQFVVNINEAAWPELAQLPGIGPTMARRIIQHRAAQGPFQTTEDLMTVKGIGEKMYAAMSPHLTVGNKEPVNRTTPRSLASQP